ncbi:MULTISPECIES: ATP synthase F1 subunit delta [Enterococcus]|uniref:ATP synthase subunit delta n=1 Tax=Enterococcus diestrammenae TaxID=1155073 RepID=A0ABV0F6Q3_9ENTE|nr:ATP synthase F1 subunit delta [Enterococcus diestrammenae]KAF1297785.1 ATP synthase F1 subunit delta [Enterococcus diestrammenae]
MKLNKHTVGKRYGKALFELAAEENQSEAVYQDLLKLRQIYQEIPDLGNMLSDVRLDLAAKKQLLGHLTAGFDGLVKNFLLVADRYNRMADVPLIIDDYELRYDEEKGLILGTVTTAVAMSSEQKSRLEASVAKRLGYETAQLTAKVDPQIVGGVVVEVQDRVIDGSVAAQLAKLRDLLK